MHIKRLSSSRIWPITRKGTKYVVVPTHEKERGIPLLIVMRDILKIVRNRKEMKKILVERKVLVNDSIVRNEKMALVLLDTISIPSINKNYRITLSKNGKIDIEEINDSESKKKIVKITSKKILKGGKIQLNMSDGRNLISDKKVNIGDSLLIGFKAKNIEEIMPIKEKAKVLVIKGKHLGKSGNLTGIGKEVTISYEGKDLKVKNEDVMIIK